MSDENTKTGLAAGAGGALGAALATLANKKVSAAPGFSLDEAAMNLLISIAQSGEGIDGNTLEALATLAGIKDSIDKLAAAFGINILENPTDIAAFRIIVPVVGTPVELPDRIVPYGLDFLIKALPTNRGVIWVANSRPEALNVNSVYQLIANEHVEYQIKNTGKLWLNTTIAGEGVCCTVEQRGQV